MAKIIEDEATETEVQAPAAESTENTSTNESPAGQDTSSTPPVAEVDLTAFLETLNSAVAGVGGDGTPTPEGVAAVQGAYQALDGSKAKAAARKRIQAEMKKAVQDHEMTRALAITLLEEDMTKGATKKSAKTSTPKAPVDPTEKYVSERLALTLGLGLLPKPEGVAADADQQVETAYGNQYQSAVDYLAWLQADKDSRGDEPEATDAAKNGAKLALGKKTSKGSRASSGGGSSYDGPRRNVNDHISEVFASQDSGAALKIGEVAKTKTSVYPAGDASPGAITSRADSGKLPEGISADKRDGVRVLVKA